jgi:hypothetical protein
MSWLISAALASAAWCAPPRQLQPIAADEFRSGLANWRLEAEDARAVVTAQDGVLDIQTPAGLSLWWKDRLTGDYTIRFTAMALPAPESAGPHAGRLSDLISAYDDLRAYYVGFGANANTTTRLRVYDGERRLVAGFADAGIAEPGERAMSEATRLHAGQSLAIEIISSTTAPQLRWSVNDQALFTRAEQESRLQGHFALRTTASRLQIRDFQILQCR